MSSSSISFSISTKSESSDSNVCSGKNNKPSQPISNSDITVLSKNDINVNQTDQRSQEPINTTESVSKKRKTFDGKKEQNGKKSQKANRKNDKVQYTQFTFPVKGCIIVIRIENNGKTRSRFLTRTLIGRVNEIIEISSHFVIVKAVYFDQINDKIISREDELPFCDYGIFKNWYVKNTDGCDDVMKKINQPNACVFEVSPLDTPLAFRSKSNRIKVDENIACEICKSLDSRTTVKGDMLLCDGCNKGYHQKCVTPHVMLIPKDKWFCTSCKNIT